MIEKHGWPVTEPLPNVEWFQGVTQDTPPEYEDGAAEGTYMALAAPEKPPITLQDIRGLFRMADAEVALGVEPIDLLEAELDKTKDEWASGGALFGPGGIYSDEQNAFLSVRALDIRANWNEEKQGKLTEARAKDEAHADAKYQAFLLDKKLERARWLLLDHARDVIFARMSRGSALLRATSRGG